MKKDEIVLEVAKICKSVQRFAKVGKSNQHYAKWYKSMLKYNNMQKIFNIYFNRIIEHESRWKYKILKTIRKKITHKYIKAY